MIFQHVLAVGIGEQNENFHSACECRSAIIAFIIDFWFLTSFYFAFLLELHRCTSGELSSLRATTRSVCVSHILMTNCFPILNACSKTLFMILLIDIKLTSSPWENNKNSIQLFPLATDDRRQLYAITRSEKKECLNLDTEAQQQKSKKRRSTSGKKNGMGRK